MADLHCPNCGKTNPGDFEYCQSCGNRLAKDASIRPGDEPIRRATSEFEGASTSGTEAIHPGEAPTKKNTGELERALPNWLRDLRGKNDEVPVGEPPTPESDASLPTPPPPSASVKPASGSIDWLAGLNASADEEEVPDWLKEIRSKTEEPAAPDFVPPPAPAAPEPDRLSRIRGLAQEAEPIPPVDQPAEPEPATGLPDWFSSLRSEPEASAPVESAPEIDSGISDWLASLDKASNAGQPVESTPAEADWMARLKEETTGAGTSPETPATEIPDWLSGLPTATSAPVEEPEPTVEPSGELPDWLGKLQSNGVAAETPQTAPAQNPDWLTSLPAESTPVETAKPAGAPAENLDWLNTMPAASHPAEESAAAAAKPGEMPDWLKSMQPASEAPAEEPRAKAKPFETGSLPPVGIGSEVPDWLSKLQAETPAPAEEPAAAPALPPAELPAWLSEKREPAAQPVFSEQSTGQSELPAAFTMQQPDWLSKLGPEKPAEPAPAREAAPAETELPESLEKGELPSWVQAMRPVADVVADAKIEAAPPSSDLPVEERGPLAGLRGVLPAGIGMGVTRKPPTYSIKLQVGESQQKHSSRLEKSIASEGEPGALHIGERISSARILRWVIAAVLLVVVSLTIISGMDLGMTGVVYPPEMGAAMHLVSDLQPNAPVLVVFDYQPALSGELEAAAAPVMNDLLLKGARITILSTTPTGPALAERFMHNTQGQHNYQPGQQYVNLGYLAGGPAGVLDFAAEPQVAAPFTVTGENAWALLPLQNVQRLSDFSLVLLLTDDADVGRVWIEQAGPELGATPMAMVISAQAEPMIRPYYDSGQIKGLVTGLAGGYAYGDAGPGRSYWNAFGVGILAAEIMILIGAVMSAVAALRSRRAAKEGGV
jgi:hypothetical protein